MGEFSAANDGEVGVLEAPGRGEGDGGPAATPLGGLYAPTGDRGDEGRADGGRTAWDALAGRQGRQDGNPGHSPVPRGEWGHLIVRANLRDGLPLADESVHCVVTSPPYFQLRDYGVKGQLGLERTVDEYIANQVEVFREVRRVLRTDGSLWLNIGDSYNGGGIGGGQKGATLDGASNRSRQGESRKTTKVPGLKQKDLVGIPWMLAFALRADGWYLRSEIIWNKPNPMPESVRDRPTKSHEQVFLLAKSPQYFYDEVASSEPAKGKTHHDLTSPGYHAPGQAPNSGNRKKLHGPTYSRHRTSVPGGQDLRSEPSAFRNCRSVWTITTRPFKAAHFATMPLSLASQCIKAGTSERGCCPRCGAPWVRIVERERVATRPGTNSKVNRASQHEDSPYHGHHGSVIGNRDPFRHTTTAIGVGWESSCTCLEPDPVPCRVFDPYGGAMTTARASQILGRHSVSTEISADYIAIGAARLAEPLPTEKKARRPGRGAGNAARPAVATVGGPTCFWTEES